jgi:sentrin-specific protease 1
MELKKIQYYDSMGGTDYKKLEGLLQYLKDEWVAKKKGGELDVSEWTLVGCTPETPRQLNGEFFFCLCVCVLWHCQFCYLTSYIYISSSLLGVDCGVFTCMFADFVTKDCEPVFNQTHITQCRQRIALSIMKNCAIE